MEKFKNALTVIIMVACFIGVIGLLMAYSDGLLDGTAIAKIISIAFPSLLGAYVIALVVTYWVNSIFKGYVSAGIVFLIALILLAICITLLNKAVLTVIALTILVLTMITLIIFWIIK